MLETILDEGLNTEKPFLILKMGGIFKRFILKMTLYTDNEIDIDNLK